MLAGLHWSRPAVVADRDLHLGDGRVVRADDADDRGVRHERLHVLGALLLVVLAVDRVVERDDLELVAADAAGLVGLVDGELRALEGRLAVGRRAARQRERDADLERPLVGAELVPAPLLAAGVPDARGRDDDGSQRDRADTRESS